MTPFVCSSCRVGIKIRNVDQALSKLSRTSDNWILAVLTQETEGLDPNLPVVELALRGTTPEPCLERRPGRDCGAKGGIVARVTANIAHDRTLDWEEDEAGSLLKSCGDGLNYHQRLAIGPVAADGSITVHVAWNATTFRVDTAVDSWQVPVRVPHTLSFGRLIAGAPWDRRPAETWRSWLWRPFSAGVPVEAVKWIIKEPMPVVRRCP